MTVEQGTLTGVTDGGVVRYLGLPFAAPPVGELRWRDPLEPARWSRRGGAGAVERARWSGRGGAVFGTPPSTVSGAHSPRHRPAPPHATAAREAEDCLTLGVTVPTGTNPRSRLPVLVWVHGGGFSTGSGSDVDPRRLTEAGPLIVVTVNHRRRGPGPGGAVRVRS